MHRHLIYNFVFIGLIFICFASEAQQYSTSKPNLLFKNISDGLNSERITSIYQDKLGFIWIGSYNGLHRFDGVSFKVYTNTADSTSIPNSRIEKIFSDSKGNLWIGTANGLCRYNWETDNFRRYQTKNLPHSEDPAPKKISAIVEDEEGRLWIASTKEGLLYYDPKSDAVFSYFGEEKVSANNKFVTDLCVGEGKTLWIGFNNGLKRLNTQSGEINSIEGLHPDGERLAGKYIRGLSLDHNGDLWVGTWENGLFLFRTTGEQHQNFAKFVHDPHNANSLGNNSIYTIFMDRQQQIWVGNENGGLHLFDRENKEFYRYLPDTEKRNSISNNSIWSIFEDNNNRLWIGTGLTGVDIIDKYSIKFTHYYSSPLNPQGLNNNLVRGFREDNHGNVWIATDGGGLNYWDRSKDIFKHYVHDPKNARSLASNAILDLSEDDDGRLWIATWEGGINVLTDPIRMHFSKLKDLQTQDSLAASIKHTFSLLKDSKGIMWSGNFEGGLGKHDLASGNTTVFYNDPQQENSLSNNTINTLLEDSEGNIWAGAAFNGLNKLEYKNGVPQFIRYLPKLHDTTTISGDLINQVYEDSKGNIWVATDKGLSKLMKPEEKFINYSKKDGLPSDIIEAIVEDEHGFLWISTAKGLSKFDPQAVFFKNYAVIDGLQGNNFSRHAVLGLKSGEIMFGGSNGFNIFHPDSVKDNPYKPEVYITGLKLFNKPITINDSDSILNAPVYLTKAITLRHNQNIISLDFVALNYTHPSKNRYAFMLEGLEKEWNFVGNQQSATYTNLDPGVYTFRVKGANNDGLWNDEGTSLQITVLPPYWQTWWFRSLVLLGIFGSIVAIIRWRVTTVEQQKKYLEREVKERTQQLETLTKEEREARLEAEKANSAKSVFLATMSHEIRTPMNGVIGMASLLAETKQSPEQKDYTETIRSCGENLLTVINDILDFSKIESGNMDLDKQDFDLRTTIEEVLEVFAEKAAKLNLDLIYQLDHDVPIQLIGDKIRLRQILMNLVGNAIKFTEEGEIFVGVHLLKENNSNLVLGFEVRDTGIGIPRDKIPLLFKAFSQVDASATRKFSGTGLGLVICKKLISLMGGDISVESVEDKGSTFSFSIQIEKSAAPSINYVHRNIAYLEGKKVLVVDDNYTNRSILKSQLALWKLVPTLVSSALEAEQALQNGHTFDLIITDMQMPSTDGIELARSIRSKHPQIPLILLSSVGDDSHLKHKGLFSSVLTKPVKHCVLFEHVKNALSPQKSNQPQEKDAKTVLSDKMALAYPLNILVAEDNLVNQKLILLVLGKMGYKADVVTNGIEALDAVNSKSYEVVLMDIQMPEMDGLEATRKIRKEFKELPFIIAMTANAMQGDKEECLEAGMDDYITKPIKVEEVIRVLKDCFQKMDQLKKGWEHQA